MLFMGPELWVTITLRPGRAVTVKQHPIAILYILDIKMTQLNLELNCFYLLAEVYPSPVVLLLSIDVSNLGWPIISASGRVRHFRSKWVGSENLALRSDSLLYA